MIVVLAMTVATIFALLGMAMFNGRYALQLTLHSDSCVCMCVCTCVCVCAESE